nr:acyltransferase family protein [Sagittula salina]
MSTHSPISYRPEIDGLRTIAVVPVILYHLKIPIAGGTLLPGGFLGVDVFFVISGFLITQILLAERERTGRFSLWRFYQRRARRILPALLMVMLASAVAAWAIMQPDELRRFSESAVAALAFVSNIFWYFRLGEYGAQSGLMQPMLHTWSLAIEEQFYLVFPLLLMALPVRQPRLVAGVLIGLLLASLILAQATTLWNHDLSFFSPVSRAWELLAGALLAVAARRLPGRALPAWGGLGRLLPALALAVLLASMALVHLPEVDHPGLVSLPTVLATMVLLWFTRPSEPVTRLLSLPPVVYIGKLSYSLYLWHFPIFAFGRLCAVDLPGPLDWAAWVLLTLACSIAGYHLVERRFRFDVGNRALAATLLVSVALVVGFAGLVRETNLLVRERDGDLVALYGANEMDNKKLAARSWSILDQLAGDEKIRGTKAARGPSRDESTRNWFTAPEALHVLIVGNSHSKDLFNALHLNAEAFPGMQFARFGMATAFPEDQRRTLYAAPNFAAADVVLIAPRYADDYAARLPGFIAELQERGKRVALVDNTAEVVSPGTLPIVDWFIHRYRATPEPDAINGRAYKAESSKPKRTNAVLAQIAGRAGEPLLSRRELLCDDAAQRCTVLTPEGRKAMYDYGHWTLEGAAHFGALAAERDWLAPLRDQPR